MNARRVSCRTAGPNGGCLSPPLPSRRMDRDPHHLPDIPSPSPEASTEFSAGRLDASHSRSRLARLARSTRGRIGAALVALAGTGTAANQANAATIMMPGEIVPRADVAEQPEYALALTNDNIRYSIAHADGTSDAVMTWFGVQRPDGDVLLDWYADDGSDVPSTVIAPDDQIGDGRRSNFFLTIADLPELSTLRYGFNPNFADGSDANLHHFLQGDLVAAGFGPLTGEGLPQTIDEAIARTDGPVMTGHYAESVQLDDAWIFRNVQPTGSPEPSALGLAGAAIAAGLANRRRLKNAVKHKG